jgi:hypothetical protein
MMHTCMAEPFWGLQFLAISQFSGLKARVQYLIEIQGMNEWSV